jgi:predicted nucleotidyltransferase
MDTSLAERVKAVLAPQPDLQAAWLVGSHARGQARPDSDVDVAVLPAPAAAGSGLDDAVRCGRPSDDLAGAPHSPVDVLDVERVAPITFALIMRDAQFLLDRDRARRIDVMARQYAVWQDMQPHYGLQREAVSGYFVRRSR